MENNYSDLENRISEHLSIMSSTFFELSFMNEHEDDQHLKNLSYIEKKDGLEETFKNSAEIIYLQIIVYLELRGLKYYLQLFLKEFVKPTTFKELLKEGYSNEFNSSYSIHVSKIWHFLSPFGFIHQTEIDYLLKEKGVVILENILKNTQIIITKGNTKPCSEPDVYKSVKYVVECVFNSAVKPSSDFQKLFKKYSPDILIPEIHVAVEYKYITSEKQIGTFLDQIAADTKGYTRDPKYKLFYAVFYAIDDFYGATRFEEAWKEMDFPKNWRAIYVIGKNYKK